MTIHSNFYNLFDKSGINAMAIRLTKTCLNSKTRGKSKFTNIELFHFTNIVKSDNIQVFNIYSSKEDWLKALDMFIGEPQEIETIQFNYNNYFYEKNESIGREGLETETYKLVDQETTVIDEGQLLCIQTKKETIDASAFSCSNNLNKKNLKQYRIKISDRAPIYLSLIYDINMNRYFIKCWFPIDSDIDVVLEELGY